VISPTVVNVSEKYTFTFTITNDGWDPPTNSDPNLGSAYLYVPAGFTLVSLDGVTPSSGKSWTGSIDSTYDQIKLVAATDDDRLNPHESIVVKFDAVAPNAKGYYLWDSHAWVDRDFQGQDFLNSASSSVTVVVNSPSFVTISGKSFEDINGNGTLDPGETGLSGWTINLMQGATVISSTVTGSDGSYSFIGVSPGTYALVEEPKVGWTQTVSPPNPIVAKSGYDITDMNFGNQMIPYTLIVDIVGSGSVMKTPNQIIYHYGDIVQLTASPAIGWIFSAWGGAAGSDGKVTINGDMVASVTFIRDTFEMETFTIVASAVGHGSIDPLGAVLVDEGADQSFKMKPDSDYHVTSILIDGKLVAVADSYTVHKVMADHTISVRFETDQTPVEMVDITILSSPSGPGFVNVDGTPITTPQMFTWIVGSTHSIAANSPIVGETGVRYIYSSWSDGGAQFHSCHHSQLRHTVQAYYSY
jgi:hypothetical protein